MDTRGKKGNLLLLLCEVKSPKNLNFYKIGWFLRHSLDWAFLILESQEFLEFAFSNELCKYRMSFVTCFFLVINSLSRGVVCFQPS